VTRAQLVARRIPPLRASRKTVRWCVAGGGSVTASLRGGRAERIKTTARGHRTARRVGPGSSAARLRRAYPRQPGWLSFRTRRNRVTSVSISRAVLP
jgi:hypothetical protein